MATSSDQIQAEIAQTRERMSARLDAVGSSQQGNVTGLTSTISEQVRRRPVAAIGLSLVAGALLQEYLAGGQAGSASASASGATESAGETASQTAEQVVDTTKETAGAVATTATDVANRVASTTRDVASQVAATTRDAAGQVSESVGNLTSTISEQVRTRPVAAIGLSVAAGSLLQQYLSGGQAGSGGAPASGATQSADETASQTAEQVVDTTKETAGAVVTTATDVANRVASTTGDVASQMAATTRDAAGQVSQRATDLLTTTTQQVERRPLTALGVAIAAGMVLQPTLAPRVSQVTQSVRGPASALGSGIAETFALPEPDEVERIKAALVPATVERARQFTSRDLREYLDTSLEGVVGPTSLRGGIVAAATEKAEDLVNNRLPDVLSRNLSGTRGLLALAIAGEVLKARSEAQQGQGQTLGNIKTDLAQSLSQTSRAQLLRYFPEFREQYESSTSEEGSKRCSNCEAELPPAARFCPSCGTPA